MSSIKHVGVYRNLQSLRRWRSDNYCCTSNTSVLSLNLSNAGIIRHMSSKVCDVNSTGLNLTTLDHVFDVKESGDFNRTRRRTDKLSRQMNRKNKYFFGDYI